MQNVVIPIRDLGVIGDQRTAALVARDGSIVWYCPERFDRPSLFAALLDPKGGSWRVELPGGTPTERGYISGSGVLETRLSCSAGELILTDWMSMGTDAPVGAICRMLSAAPCDLSVVFAPAPDYRRAAASLVTGGGGLHVQHDQTLFASHALTVAGGQATLSVPAGEASWIVLVGRGLPRPDAVTVMHWLATTLERWGEITAHDKCNGAYACAVQNSLRALRLLTHAASGGIVAAITTSLPEVPGGTRNYDYRYVWLRDAGMIASALTRINASSKQSARFFDFICASGARSEHIFLPPALSLDGTTIPEEVPIETLAGYDGSDPVLVGNDARTQLQLDALGNVLLVAKLMYDQTPERPHLAMVAQVADFIAAHWQEPDFGLWEERERAQYTSSKAIMACGLEFIADHGSGTQVERWRAAAEAIRAYVAASCLTGSGAYAAVAGGEAVDVSAALFPIWAFCDADTPEMVATIHEIERDLASGSLYRRRLEHFPSAREGMFLSGTLWVAQYWVMRRDIAKARRIIDASLDYANDLGFFAEEGAPGSGEMLGNFPQSFVHAAFIGAAFDLAKAGDELGDLSKESWHDRQA